MFVIHIPGSVSAQSCNTDGIARYNFSDIKHILDNNQCNSCHSKSNPTNTWHYESYEAASGISSCRTPVIVPGDIISSLLVDKINGGWVACGNSMPPGNKSVKPEDLLAIENWIQSGAPEFCIPTYEDIRSIPEINACKNCHNQAGSWNFNSYTGLYLNHSGPYCTDEKIIVPGNASKSLLYTKLNEHTLMCGQLMPLNSEPLSYYAVAKIRDWINAGAPEFAKPLPVVLEELLIQNHDDLNVSLFWSTASELNTRTFEIQHSTDGIRFYPLGNIDALGSLNKTTPYVYNHDTPRVGYNYYRLRIIDLDEAFTYSPIRVTLIKNTSEIYTVYPNPVNSEGTLIMEWLPVDDREKVKLYMMDITGKLAFETAIHSGINNIRLPRLKNGVYYISVKDYNESYRIQRIVITNP